MHLPAPAPRGRWLPRDLEPSRARRSFTLLFGGTLSAPRSARFVPPTPGLSGAMAPTDLSLSHGQNFFRCVRLQDGLREGTGQGPCQSLSPSSPTPKVPAQKVQRYACGTRHPLEHRLLEVRDRSRIFDEQALVVKVVRIARRPCGVG